MADLQEHRRALEDALANAAAASTPKIRDLWLVLAEAYRTLIEAETEIPLPKVNGTGSLSEHRRSS